MAERGDAGVARIKELTANVGADSVLECVGTKELMAQALECARPGSTIGYVGVPHGVEFDGQQLFFSKRGLMGGPAPVRRFLPHLMDLVLDRKINPARCSTLSCLCRTSPRDTGRWTSGAPSKSCCASDPTIQGGNNAKT